MFTVWGRSVVEKGLPKPLIIDQNVRMDTSGDGVVCARCGHARKKDVGVGRRLKGALRRRPVRVSCEEPTDLGWPCPCRSRFHAA